jgi:hypothetical protein
MRARPIWVEFKMFPPEGWKPPVIPAGRRLEVHDRPGPRTGSGSRSSSTGWHDPELKKYLILKARQLGITLLACAYALWLMLYRPGSFSVAYSYTEDEAKKLVQATWAMYQALPRSSSARRGHHAEARRGAGRVDQAQAPGRPHLVLPGAPGHQEARPRRPRQLRDHGRGRVHGLREATSTRRSTRPPRADARSW